MYRLAGSLGFLVIVAFSGCSKPNWQISAENKSDVPCDVLVTMGADSNRTARIDKLSKGPPQVMIAEPGDMLVRSVKVTRNGVEQPLTVEQTLRAGGALEITIDEKGRAESKIR